MTTRIYASYMVGCFNRLQRLRAQSLRETKCLFAGRRRAASNRVVGSTQTSDDITKSRPKWFGGPNNGNCRGIAGRLAAGLPAGFSPPSFFLRLHRKRSGSSEQAHVVLKP